MATFSQYFKVCKEEAEAAVVDTIVVEEPVESEADLREELAESNAELKESCDESAKTEEVIANTQEQITAQKQALEKPEEVTPAQVVLAAESFRANLRLLGLDSSSVSSLNYVNSESITSSPAQMLSILTVDMEGFVDTAKNVGNTIVETIKKLLAKIKEIISKLTAVTTKKVGELIHKIEEKIKKLGTENVKYDKDKLDVLNKYVGIITYCKNFKNASEAFNTYLEEQIKANSTRMNFHNDLIGRDDINNIDTKGLYSVSNKLSFDNKPILEIHTLHLVLLNSIEIDKNRLKINDEKVTPDNNSFNLDEFLDKNSNLKEFSNVLKNVGKLMSNNVEMDKKYEMLGKNLGEKDTAKNGQLLVSFYQLSQKFIAHNSNTLGAFIRLCTEMENAAVDKK